MTNTVLIGIIGTMCGIYFGWAAYKRAESAACKGEGKESGAMASDIGYIKAGIDDLKRKQEKAEERHIEVITRLTAVEAKVEKIESDK